MRARVKHAWLATAFTVALSPGGAMASNLSRAVEFFQKLDKDHMELVDQFYDRNVVFQDPVHKLNGSAAVRTYYEGLYRNAAAIRFEYSKQLEDRDTVVLAWRMFLRTPAIDDGREITVDGTSVITFGGPDGKAIAHRDYFDMGEFVYERVPVLRSIIRYIKGRMAGS
jgi:limonene-1,2-epoxide hydrolase